MSTKKKNKPAATPPTTVIEACSFYGTAPANAHLEAIGVALASAAEANAEAIKAIATRLGGTVYMNAPMVHVDSNS